MHSAPRAGSRATEVRQSNICRLRLPFVQIRSGRTTSAPYLQLRHWNDAIQSFRKSLELNPGSVDSTVHLAAALSEAGQPVEAIDLLVTLART